MFEFTDKEVRGKKVVFFGDSITEGCKTTGWHVGFPMESKFAYPNLLANEMGFSYRNFAIGGSRLTYTTAIAQGCAPGVGTIYEHGEDIAWADIAVVAYGTNDFHGGAPIGSITDSPKNVEDVNTFYGALDFVVKTLKKNNPKIKAVILTPFNRTNPVAWTPHVINPNTGYHLNESYGGAVREKVKSLNDENVSVIDTWACFTDSDMLKDNGNTIDGVHPNDSGHRMIANYILNYYKGKK